MRLFGDLHQAVCIVSRHYPVMCSTELVAVVLKRGLCRASVQDSLYLLGFHDSGVQVQQTYLRVVVQLPHIRPEAHRAMYYLYFKDKYSHMSAQSAFHIVSVKTNICNIQC